MSKETIFRSRPSRFERVSKVIFGVALPVGVVALGFLKPITVHMQDMGASDLNNIDMLEDGLAYEPYADQYPNQYTNWNSPDEGNKPSAPANNDNPSNLRKLWEENVSAGELTGSYPNISVDNEHATIYADILNGDMVTIATSTVGLVGLSIATRARRELVPTYRAEITEL